MLEQFKNGSLKVLIATDVSSRGIDIPGIDFVVNYDLPDQAENYVHRVGRTGRGRAKGQALTFCSTGEKELLEAIEKYTSVPIEVAEINKAEYQETVTFTEQGTDNWQALLEKDEADKKKKRKGKKKK